MKKKIFYVFMSFLVAFCTTISPAFADDIPTSERPSVWIQLSPVLKSFELSPGEDAEDTFTVQNIGSGTFSYKVYAAPYNITSEQYDADFSQDTAYTQISRWVTFKDADGNFSESATFTIEPEELQEIAFRINTPEDLPAGSQHAIIFAESLKKSEVQGVSAVSRVGLNLRAVALGETNKSSAITDWNTPSYLPSGNINSSILVKNTGNVDIAAGYDYTIENISGKILYEKNNALDVLAATNRRFDFEWEETPLAGIFNVKLTIAAGNSTETYSQIVVVLPPAIIVITVLTAAFFIIMLILFIRHRRSRNIVY